MEQNNAWLYCRIDSPEDTYGILETQYQQLKHYAEQMRLTVVGASHDLSSGLHLNRPGLQAVKSAAESGNIQTMLVVSVGRIGRNTDEVSQFISDLSRLGVQAYSLKQGEITPQDLALPTMGFSMNHS